jgi:hypothetical protein
LIQDAPKTLTSASEDALMGWIRAHLSVAIHPFRTLTHSMTSSNVSWRTARPTTQHNHLLATPLRLRIAQLRRRLNAEPDVSAHRWLPADQASSTASDEDRSR